MAFALKLECSYYRFYTLKYFTLVVVAAFRKYKFQYLGTLKATRLEPGGHQSCVVGPVGCQPPDHIPLLCPSKLFIYKPGIA